MNKKGDLTSTQIIILVITISGFILVLGIFTTLDLNKNKEKEICRLSVLTRGTSPQELQSFVPLKCTTEKICLSDKKGNCLESFAGEKEITKKKISTASEIEEISAKSILDCWDQMGEGKIDLYGSFIETYTGVDELSCVICSRIALDIPQELFNEINIQEYIENTKVPNSEFTYLETLTDRRIKSFIDVDLENLDEIDKNEKFTNSNTDELAVVFTQIKPEGYLKTLERIGKAGISITASGLITSGGIGAKPALIAGGIGTIGLSAYSIPNIYRGKALATTHCQEWIPNKESSAGCSSVQIVPYNVQALESICQRLEGNV